MVSLIPPTAQGISVFYYCFNQNNQTSTNTMKKVENIVNKVFVAPKFRGAQIKRVDSTSVFCTFVEHVRKDTLEKELAKHQLTVPISVFKTTFADEDKQREFENYIQYFQIFPNRNLDTSNVKFPEVKGLVETIILTKWPGKIERESKILKSVYISTSGKVTTLKIKTHLKSQGFNNLIVENPLTLPSQQQIKALERMYNRQ